MNSFLDEKHRSNQLLRRIAELIPSMYSGNKYHAVNFLEMLFRMPASGGGGLHTFLLGLANHAVRFGLSEDAFVAVLLPRITGTRPVYEKEVMEAYRRAANDYDEGVFATAAGGGGRSTHNAVNEERNKALREQRDQYIRDGQGVTAEDIMMESPVMIPVNPVAQVVLLLMQLYYQTGSLLFAGQHNDWAIMRKTLRGDIRWWQYFQKIGFVDVAHIIPNPLTGEWGRNKAGSGWTKRGDNCVKRFRFAVAEFDDFSLLDQLAFWSQVELPIVALIHSGNKSVHAWIRVDGVSTLEQWDVEVKQKLYSQYLIPMGVDSSCSNAARLSRMPGHIRKDTGKCQQLIYLNPNGTQGPIL